MSYEYTELTWRRRDTIGYIHNHVHVIYDKERAADEIKELALTPGVFALRFIHHGEHEASDTQA